MRTLKFILISISLLFPSLSFAIGGNDPVPGIDIIIKKIPNPEETITNFSLSETEIKKYNALKGNHHSYLSKTLLRRLAVVNKQHNLAIKWDEIVHKGVNQQWCTPERCNINTKIVIELHIPKDYPKSKIIFLLKAKKITPNSRPIPVSSKHELGVNLKPKKPLSKQ